MKHNPSEKIIIYKNRDVSPYLFHFVKSGEYVQPLDVLKKILKENLLIAKRYDYVSYTESPLRPMLDVLEYFQEFKDKPNCKPMFEPYGIGIPKELMFKEYNARPVWYGTRDDDLLIPESLRWRFETFDMEQCDFSWQREWRTKGKTFELPEDDEDVIVICKYEIEAEALRNESNHPCISLEWVEQNHASDFDVQSYASIQMMSDFEIESLREECEEIRKKHKNNIYGESRRHTEE